MINFIDNTENGYVIIQTYPYGFDKDAIRMKTCSLEICHITVKMMMT